MSSKKFHAYVHDAISGIQEVTSSFNKILRAYNPDLNEKLDRFYELLNSCDTTHLYAKGRTGAPAVALALRLSHFGYKVSFIGDLIKDRMKEDDTSIFMSGSGETKEVLAVADTAKEAGCKIIGVTSFPNSSLGKLADLLFLLPGGIKKERGWEYMPAQLGEYVEILNNNTSYKTQDLGKIKELLGKFPEYFFSGGAFEMNAFLFQESLITAIGKMKKKTQSDVARKHTRD